MGVRKVTTLSAVALKEQREMKRGKVSMFTKCMPGTSESVNYD